MNSSGRPRHSVLGWRCAVCGTDVDIATPDPWRCPRATATDRHHVLHAIVHRPDPSAGLGDGPTAFHRNDAHLAWAAAAAARGMTSTARAALLTELDDAIRRASGVGFHDTPFARSDLLSDALGFGDGGVWVKDETGNVAGSQKARHLFGILAHLRAHEVLAGAHETDRPPLAIASCGNAALAAATLAGAVGWPIDVYVPTWMSDGFGDELDRLGARVHRCERRSSDPPGDPAMLRFREAVTAGAIPFTVQGPENALCLDAGRTIGWELAEQLAVAGPSELDALFVQVGGGAFAACAANGLAEAGRSTPLVAVQAAGCAPLVHAWEAGASSASTWADVMTPWPEPSSIADGILDDETYDWLAVVEAIHATGGQAVAAEEEHIERAWYLAREAGFDCSATGSAGLAGLVQLLADEPERWRDRRVAVIVSGVRR